MLKLISAADYLPVTVDDARARLHIDTNDFDDELELLLESAVESAESKTNMALRVSSWEWRPGEYRDYGARWPINPYDLHWTLDRGLSIPFPRLSIPQAPIRTVTEIRYLDKDNVEQTVDSAAWNWVRTRAGADIAFEPDYVFPELSIRPQPVRVAFDAGYDDPNSDASGMGDDPELAFPKRLAMAILFLVAHWHTNRSPVVSDTRAAPFEIPQTFDDLIGQLKVYRDHV